MIIKNIQFIYHKYLYVVKHKDLTCCKYVARRRRHSRKMDGILWNAKLLKLISTKYFAS